MKLSFLSPPTVTDLTVFKAACIDSNGAHPSSAIIIGNDMNIGFSVFIGAAVTIDPPPNGVQISGVDMCAGTYINPL